MCASMCLLVYVCVCVCVWCVWRLKCWDASLFVRNAWACLYMLARPDGTGSFSYEVDACESRCCSSLMSFRCVDTCLDVVYKSYMFRCVDTCLDVVYKAEAPKLNTQ